MSDETTNTTTDEGVLGTETGTEENTGTTETTESTAADTTTDGDTTSGTTDGEDSADILGTEPGTDKTGTEGSDDGETDGDNSFLESLPEELRGHERLQGIKSVEDLAKAFTEMEAAAVVPESYQFAEGADESATSLLSAYAKDAGMTQDQLDKTIGFYHHIRSENEKAFAETETAWSKELDTAYGDKKDDVLREANNCLKKMDPDGNLTKLIVEGRLTRHPAIIHHFHELATKLGEDVFETTTSGSAERSAAEVLYG